MLSLGGAEVELLKYLRRRARVRLVQPRVIVWIRGTISPKPDPSQTQARPIQHQSLTCTSTKLEPSHAFWSFCQRKTLEAGSWTRDLCYHDNRSTLQWLAARRQRVWSRTSFVRSAKSAALRDRMSQRPWLRSWWVSRQFVWHATRLASCMQIHPDFHSTLFSRDARNKSPDVKALVKSRLYQYPFNSQKPLIVEVGV